MHKHPHCPEPHRMIAGEGSEQREVENLVACLFCLSLHLFDQGTKIMNAVDDLQTQVTQILQDEQDLKAATAAGIAAVIAKLNVAQPDLSAVSTALGTIHANLLADKQAVVEETAAVLDPPVVPDPAAAVPA